MGLNIEVKQELLDELYNVGMHHYPKEFGGLLVGYYADDYKTCFIETTILPKKYKSSRYSFERGKEGLKKKLTEYYSNDPKLFYVGEWHTHPDSSTVPSGTDYKAMSEIAESDDVLIQNPILLILGITNDNYTYDFFIHHNKNLKQYDK
jgi:integrative and conjugative element protein (TIGR02256 family)